MEAKQEQLRHSAYVYEGGNLLKTSYGDCN